MIAELNRFPILSLHFSINIKDEINILPHCCLYDSTNSTDVRSGQRRAYSVS